MTLKLGTIALLGLLPLSSGMANAATAVVTVYGNDNLSLAGLPDGSPCCIGDSAPTESPTLALTGFATGSAITFSTKGGFLHFPGPVNPTTDGSGAWNMTTYTGVSAAQNVLLNGLVGVFLTDAVPGGPAPAQRNDGISFLSLSPELNQIFWIGDGLTGTGSGDVQTFFAPVGATRLFLGTADGYGWYNNVGSAEVTINYSAVGGAVPEPATWAMMLAGFGIVGAGMRRRAVRVAFA